MEKHLLIEVGNGICRQEQFLLGDQLRLKQNSQLINLSNSNSKFTPEGKILVLVKWGENVLTAGNMDTG